MKSERTKELLQHVDTQHIDKRGAHEKKERVPERTVSYHKAFEKLQQGEQKLREKFFAWVSDQLQIDDLRGSFRQNPSRLKELAAAVTLFLAGCSSLPISKTEERRSTGERPDIVVEEVQVEQPISEKPAQEEEEGESTREDEPQRIQEWLTLLRQLRDNGHTITVEPILHARTQKERRLLSKAFRHQFSQLPKEDPIRTVSLAGEEGDPRDCEFEWIKHHPKVFPHYPHPFRKHEKKEKSVFFTSPFIVEIKQEGDRLLFRFQNWFDQSSEASQKKSEETWKDFSSEFVATMSSICRPEVLESMTAKLNEQLDAIEIPSVPLAEKDPVRAAAEREWHEGGEEEQRNQWLETLRMARDMGYTIRASSLVYHGSLDWDTFSHYAQPFRPFGRNPLDQLSMDHPDLLHLPPAFAAKREIEVNPFVLVTGRDKAGKLVGVGVRNWLEEGDPLISTGYFSKGAIFEEQGATRWEKEIRQQDIQDLVTAALPKNPEDFSQLQEQLRARLDSAEGTREQPKPLFSLDGTQPYSPEEKEAVDRFFREWSVELEVVPFGEAVDRDRFSQVKQESTFARVLFESGMGAIRYDVNRIHGQNSENPLSVRGHVERIVLEKQFRSEWGGMMTYDETVIPPGEMVTNDGEPIVEGWEDEHGNRCMKIVYCVMAYGPGGEEAYLAGREEGYSKPFRYIIEIKPPLLLTQEGGENGVPLNIDLERFGGGIPPFLIRDQEEAQGSVGPYALWSNVQDRRAFEELFSRESVEAFSEGIGTAEELFGRRRGEVVRSIYLQNTENANAFSDGSIVILNDEWTRRSLKASRSSGIHEGAHSIDKKCEISESSIWEQHFVRLTGNAPWFLERISEKFFSGEAERGGHAQDNSKEFLVSFVNSIISDEWVSGMRAGIQGDPRFLNHYRETARALERICIGRKGQSIPESAPIFDVLATLEGRIDQLEKDIQEGK